MILKAKSSAEEAVLCTRLRATSRSGNMGCFHQITMFDLNYYCTRSLVLVSKPMFLGMGNHLGPEEQEHYGTFKG